MSLPPNVLERIAATVRDLTDTPEVRSFVLSGSLTPAQESRGLGADAVVDLFRSEEPVEVAQVLAFVRERFAEHPKARTMSVDRVAGATHVYVALWAVPEIGDPAS